MSEGTRPPFLLRKQNYNSLGYSLLFVYAIRIRDVVNDTNTGLGPLSCSFYAESESGSPATVYAYRLITPHERLFRAFRNVHHSFWSHVAMSIVSDEMRTVEHVISA